MNRQILFHNIGQLVTCRDTGKPKSATELSDAGLIQNACVLIENDKIIFAGTETDFDNSDFGYDTAVNCKGKVMTPGFVDSHTHFVFAGSRENEYEMKVAGVTYEEIAKAGGGIVSTVKSVRETSEDDLYDMGLDRIETFLKYGTTTIEAKSGYGLDTENELKLLQVINALKDNPFGVDIIPTFLGAHAVPKEKAKEEYIEEVCGQMLKEVAADKLAKYIDVFCEEGYFTSEDTDRILSEGVKAGLIPKLHTDQFHSIGGIETALKHNAVSVDHLEVLTDEDVQRLSNGKTIACLLPGVSYFLNISYPPARKLIEANVPVALATDFNPGSCMTENMQTIMSLASVKMRMTAEEILNAVTINAAYSVGMQNTIGSIEAGKQADLILHNTKSYKYLTYHFGINHVEKVIKKGVTVIDNV